MMESKKYFVQSISKLNKIIEEVKSTVGITIPIKPYLFRDNSGAFMRGFIIEIGQYDYNADFIDGIVTSILME